MATARAFPTKSICLDLELSMDEARALQAMMQNPMRPDESVPESELRHVIFNALQEFVK